MFRISTVASIQERADALCGFGFVGENLRPDSGVTPTNTLNYLISRTAREEQTGTKLTSNVDSTTTELQYVDGLSRPIQTQIWKASPDKTKDLITVTSLYNFFGIPYKSILATPSDVATGTYKSTAETLANAFYVDTAAHNRTVFELSPLNRPDKQFGAGQAWRATGNEKFTKMSYLVAGGDVYKFTLQTNGSVQWSSSYDTSSLYSNVSTSERGFETIEFKDKQGRVTHKRQQLQTGLYATTSFVYDEANGGRLAFVIPPEAYNKFGTGSGQVTSFTENDALYKEAIYHYKFNAIGNLVEKHLPGGGTMRYVYDKNDQVVLENDSKDSTTLWKFTKHDALNRPIIRGILTNLGAKTRQAIQMDFDNFTDNPYEVRAFIGAGNPLYGYTNQSFPSTYTVVDADIKEVLYYDDHSFNSDANFNFQASNAFHTQGLATGLVTGKLTRNLQTGAWQKQILYYDYKGRLIQDFHLTNLNNLIRKDMQYRFNGELLKTRIEKKNGSTVLSTKIITYQYDHLGRKVSYVHNGKPIVKYFYDNIGRLITKKFSPSGTTQGSKQTGNWTDASSWLSGILPTLADNVTINTGQTVTIPAGEKAYAGTLNDKGILKNFGTLDMSKATTADLYSQSISYHIRGGLKGINLDASGNLTNNLFSYRLSYETANFYDGNIGKQEWKSNIDNKERSYTFSYDGASRLKSGTYASIPAGENYSLNNVDYDLNGNIKALSRSGATNTNYTNFGNVDNLTYTYQSNSNKLSKIQDATTGNADLGDFRDGTNTDDDYEYWADGSLKKDKNKKISSITYNYLKLPEIITFDDAKTITTEYDAGGTKLKKIVSGGETTDYEEDDIYVNNVLYQTSHDEGRIANGIYEYNITDHNNDLRVAFRDSSGIAVPTQSIFYDPWGLTMKGMQITRNPTNFNKSQFLNRELQIETGLVDLMRRQYNPQTGQFTSQDPVTDGQEHLSLYQYGWNNPVLKPDPNGDCPFCPAIPLILPEIVAGATVIGEAIATTAIGIGIGKLVDLAVRNGAVGVPTIGPEITTSRYEEVQRSVQNAYSSNQTQTTETSDKKSHGNKLDDKPAEGYSLRDKKTKEVKKYGETTRGEDKFGEGKQKRYGKKELEDKGVEYKKETDGTKKQMHKWQNEKIKDHKEKNDGKRPDLNKSDY